MYQSNNRWPFELDTTGKYYQVPPNIPPPPLPPVRHRSVSESYEYDVDQAFKSARDAGLFAKYQYEQNTHFDQQRRFSAPFIVPPPPPTMARSVSHPIDPMATWDTIHRSAQNNSSPEKLSHLFQVPDDLIMKGLSGLTIQEAKPISPIYQKTWPKDVNQVNTGCNFDSGFPSPDSSPSFNEQLSSLSSLEDFNLSGLTQTSGSSHNGSSLNQNLFGTYSPRRPKVPEVTLDNCIPNLTWEAPNSPLRYNRDQASQSGMALQVFLGGIPWGVDEIGMERAFARYGKVEVKWPPNHNSSPTSFDKSTSGGTQLSGFCYIIFECEKQVQRLIMESVERKGRLFLNSKIHLKPRETGSRRRRDSRTKPKDVEVIPWWTNDTQWHSDRLCEWKSASDEKKQIFIGGLHGMMTAELIARMLQELFGPVKSVVIDTDQTKYPTGSGRAVFHLHADFVKAIESRFVKVNHPKFTKRIQIDPFLQDGKFCEMDKACKKVGTRFCRSATCLKYYCESCYEYLHQRPSMREHTYTVKQKNN